MNVPRIGRVLCTNATKLCSIHRNSPILSTINRDLRQGLDKTRVESQVKSISDIESDRKHERGVISSFINKIPFLNANKSRMKAAGFILYEATVDQLNYIEFFDKLELPDTFYSWFVVTELHIWLLSVRAMAEEEDGRFLRNSLLEALWADVGVRVRKLGASDASAARAQVVELSEQLQAALIAYDEGLQSDDIVLAGALWRRFYQHQDVNPDCLNILVRYVRTRVRKLDNLPIEKLATSRALIRWSPLLH